MLKSNDDDDDDETDDDNNDVALKIINSYGVSAIVDIFSYAAKKTSIIYTFNADITCIHT